MTATPYPPVSIGLPVYNGADTVAPVIESVLAQTHTDLELVISDNASSDGTQEICQRYAGWDRRILYQRHDTNIGVLNNFTSVATAASGRFLRWIGDDDSIEPGYVEACLATFAEDPRRILVSTQIVYTDSNGVMTLDTEYAPDALSSPDPVDRFAEMLHLLTSDFASLDPLYSMFRRELALVPRRNILREDETFAARMALAGPWGHVPKPLAHRHRSSVPVGHLVNLLGVPRRQRYAMDLLQCRELLTWINRSSLERAQRRRARAEVLEMYKQRKTNKARRGVAKLARMTRRPAELSPDSVR